MLWRVVPLDSLHQSTRYGRLKSAIQAMRPVCIEVVLNQDNPLGIRIHLFTEIANHLGIVQAGSLRANYHFSLACQWLKEHEQGTGSFSFVFVIHAGHLPHRSSYRLSHFRENLFGSFIEAHLRESLVVGPRVDLQNIFHSTDESGILLRRNTPLAQAEYTTFSSARA